VTKHTAGTRNNGEPRYCAVTPLEALRRLEPSHFPTAGATQLPNPFLTTGATTPDTSYYQIEEFSINCVFIVNKQCTENLSWATWRQLRAGDGVWEKQRWCWPIVSTLGNFNALLARGTHPFVAGCQCSLLDDAVIFTFCLHLAYLLLTTWTWKYRQN
jgi:hypothetical protein